jgi:hypothetical protein
MRGRLRRYWPLLKLLLGLAIVFVIGRQFYRDLQRPSLGERPLHAGWLLASALFYLLGLGFSALFWYRLLAHLGSRPPLGLALRAYYVGHLGKYLPGKAWALFLRASLVRGGTPLGLATLTAFYEVLTTMASGVLLAGVLFALLPPQAGPDHPHVPLRALLHPDLPQEAVLENRAALLLAGLLFVPFAVVLHPAVFNRLVHRMALPFREQDADRLPAIRFRHLLEGLGLTAIGWLLLGASLAAALHGILGEALAWEGRFVLRLPAVMGLSYVAGFVILVAPSGLGVREFFLTLLLTPGLAAVPGLDWEGARAVAVLTVLVLRLVWTAAELMVAAGLYGLPSAR